MNEAEGIKLLKRLNEFLAGRGDNLKIDKTQISVLVREAVCDFQLRYTNFQFIASSRHIEFKTKYLEKPNDFNHYENEYEMLKADVNREFISICNRMLDNLKNFFNKTRKNSSGVRADIHIYNIEENESNSFNPTSSPKNIEEYTVLETALFHGLPYLEQNLPTRIKNDPTFKHGGIDIKTVRSSSYRRGYKDIPSFQRFLRMGKKISEDIKWSKMASGEISVDNKLYKSHIAVPITFKKHSFDLDENLKKILPIDSQDGARLTLGAILVDSFITNYFDSRKGSDDIYDNIDINVMYIYADLISFLFTTRANYLDQSETFDAATQLKNGR